MRIKLKSKMMIMVVVFLAVMLGGSIIVYTLFADEYYIRVMKKSMEESFYQINELPLEKPLSGEVVEQLEVYEDSGLNMLICDENYQLVFSTKEWGNNTTIYRYVKNKQGVYSNEPRVHVSGKRLNLYGIMEEDTQQYYIYLYQGIDGIRNISIYTRNLFLMFIVVTIFLGAFIVSIWGGRVVRMIKEIGIITDKIAKNDFSLYRIRSKIPNDELGDLVFSIDTMSAIIEKNIQDLKNYNYLLRERTKKIEQYQAMNQEYIATVTHDLKTPLAIIGSQVEMLGLSTEQEKKDYYTASIQEEISKMSDRISEVLKNTIIEKSLKGIVLKKTNVSEFLSELSGKYESWLKMEHMRYQFESQGDCFAMIEAETLEHAINNYISNACDHTAIGGKICLKLEYDNKNCIISVMNEGKQIDEEAVNKIWGRYYQNKSADEIGTPAYNIGLGLQIVKEIVTMHDGEYGVENIEEGVCFYIKLPKIS